MAIAPAEHGAVAVEARAVQAYAAAGDLRGAAVEIRDVDREQAVADGQIAFVLPERAAVVGRVVGGKGAADDGQVDVFAAHGAAVAVVGDDAVGVDRAVGIAAAEGEILQGDDELPVDGAAQQEQAARIVVGDLLYRRGIAQRGLAAAAAAHGQIVADEQGAAGQRDRIDAADADGVGAGIGVGRRYGLAQRAGPAVGGGGDGIVGRQGRSRDESAGQQGCTQKHERHSRQAPHGAVRAVEPPAADQGFTGVSRILYFFSISGLCWFCRRWAAWGA
ncbi:hypothetical protein ACFJIW_10255 [Tahibacter sp. UC22_41]|uniref:hypothetical protein n=1 Tax=Tahibacter sp. UC22_41 TaxID=3350178 RepID=UPI0036DAB6FF